MSDKMTPLSYGGLLKQIIREKTEQNKVFGMHKLFYAKNTPYTLFNQKLESPLGIAAGPHTQLAQNIVCAYAGGARFFELKTVQTLDGENLPVAKPCILAQDEGYNVEWSTELYVNQALEEYIKAWFLCKITAKEYGFGGSNAFMFNMSVGYDYEGITSPKIDTFIEGLKNAKNTKIWQECIKESIKALPMLKNVDKQYIEEISPDICNSITLSTLHGCPPKEIERIATYLIEEKHLHTYIKCNPTLLGYKQAREILDGLGFDYIAFDEHHFKNDLQYKDALPMINRLMAVAKAKNLSFGVKLTNTFPVQVTQKELPGEEMYMSGRALFPLSISVASMLSKDVSGLPISFSGGGDIWNTAQIINTGIYPVTVATTLLKAGGYNRLHQLAQNLEGAQIPKIADAKMVEALKLSSLKAKEYTKPIKPMPTRKINKKVPMLDCFIAPCKEGCPINQDITAYVGLCKEGRYLDALKVITEKNPLPFITGTICNHKCMDKCTRNFYEESVNIRNTKLFAAKEGYEEFLADFEPPKQTGDRIAVVGGGAAGMAAAYFLAMKGHSVTLFEQNSSLGGIVRHVVPEFRVGEEIVERDAEILRRTGVRILINTKAPSVEKLKAEGYKHIVLGIGAYKKGELQLSEGEAVNVITFLERCRSKTPQNLGKNVIIIGGGNTAMDAARAAKRCEGVEQVSIVYRRTKKYMPADEEELQLALKEGVNFLELLAPKAHKNGKLICNATKLKNADETGRKTPVETDKIVEIDADTIISAVGEKVDDCFLQANGIQTGNDGKAVVDNNLQTNLKNVYIAGDANRGPATVVEAIADALKISEAIGGVYLKTGYSFYNNKAQEKKGVLIRENSSKTEGERCLQCDNICECCVDVCPNRANIAVKIGNTTQIVHIDMLCNECGNCETFCPYESAPYKEKFTVFATKADLENSTNDGFVYGDDDQTARINGSLTNLGCISEELRQLAQAVVMYK